MKTTENYKLNQWDMTDRIQMEDFNKDNQNIENALTAHDTALAEQAAAIAQKASAADVAAAQTWVKIGEKTLSSASTSLAVSVANIQQYNEIVLYFSLAGYKTLQLVVNDTAKLVMHEMSYAVKKAVGKAFIIRCGSSGVMYAHEGKVLDNGSTGSNGTLWGQAGDALNATETLSGTVTVGVKSTSGSISAQSYLAVYGVKK